MQRALTAAEREWVQASLARAQQLGRVTALLRRALVIVCLAAAPVSVGLLHEPDKPLSRVVLLYALLVVPSLIGTVGAIAEALLGRNWLVRGFFGLGLLITLALLALGPASDAFALSILLGPFVVGLGLIAAIVRERRFRLERRCTPDVEADLRGGEALEFAGAPELGLDPPSELRGSGLVLKKGETERRFSVLPRSAILLPAPGLRVEAWIELDMVRTAISPESALTAPIPGLSQRAPLPELELAQRHMTESEAQELERHRAQLVRRALFFFVVMGYFSARIVQGAELFLGKMKHGEVSPGGWVIAGLAGLFFAVGPLRLRGRLGQALAVRKVIVARRREAADDTTPMDEVLAGDVLWTVEGQPASWRRRKL